MRTECPADQIFNVRSYPAEFYCSKHEAWFERCHFEDNDDKAGAA